MRNMREGDNNTFPMSETRVGWEGEEGREGSRLQVQCRCYILINSATSWNCRIVSRLLFAALRPESGGQQLNGRLKPARLWRIYTLMASLDPVWHCSALLRLRPVGLQTGPLRPLLHTHTLFMSLLGCNVVLNLNSLLPRTVTADVCRVSGFPFAHPRPLWSPTQKEPSSCDLVKRTVLPEPHVLQNNNDKTN